MHRGEHGLDGFLSELLRTMHHPSLKQLSRVRGIRRRLRPLVQTPLQIVQGEV